MHIAYKKLGDIATYINGYAFKPEDWSTSGLPIIRIQNLTGSSSEVNYYNGEIDEKYIVRNGDILIAWSASLGVHEWHGEDALLNQHIFKVVFDKEKINKDYFKFMVQKALERTLQFLHGSTMKHITKKYFDNLLIPFPPLEVQENIADILMLANSLVSKRKAQIEALDQLAQSVFVEMFGDWNQENSDKQFVTLADVTNLITDGVHSKPDYTDSGIPFISVKDINRGRLSFKECKYISEEAHRNYIKRCKPELGDILYTKVGATYGIPAIVDTNKEFSLYVSVALIKPKKEVIKSIYLREALKSIWIKRQADRSIKGIGVPDLHLIEIKKFRLLLPSIEEQTKFEIIIKNIEYKKYLIENGLKELENVFASIMQHAFKGELFTEEKVSNL